MLPFILELPPISHFVFRLNMKIRICADHEGFLSYDVS